MAVLALLERKPKIDRRPKAPKLLSLHDPDCIDAQAIKRAYVQSTNPKSDRGLNKLLSNHTRKCQTCRRLTKQVKESKEYLFTEEAALQDWMKDLSIREQSCIFSALRGPDTEATDEIKGWVHFIRRAALKIVSNHGYGAKIPLVRIRSLAKDSHKIDLLKMHFFQHMFLALEVIGYLHPDKQIRKLAYYGYTDLCKYLKVNPESKKEMRKRLADDSTVEFS